MSQEPQKYSITFSASALRALNETIPVKYVGAIFAFIEGPLAENPYRVGHLLAEPFAGAYSARRGVYRIIYYIHEDQVLVEVVRIAHRAVIYRPT